jgi:hypothetical protein
MFGGRINVELVEPSAVDGSSSPAGTLSCDSELSSLFGEPGEAVSGEELLSPGDEEPFVPFIGSELIPGGYREGCFRESTRGGIRWRVSG